MGEERAHGSTVRADVPRSGLTKEVAAVVLPLRGTSFVRKYRGFVPHPRLLLFPALRAKVAASVFRGGIVHNRPYLSAILA